MHLPIVGVQEWLESGAGFQPQIHRLEADATRKAGKMPALLFAAILAMSHPVSAD